MLDGVGQDVVVGGNLLDLPDELEEGFGAEGVVFGCAEVVAFELLLMVSGHLCLATGW